LFFGGIAEMVVECNSGWAEAAKDEAAIQLHSGHCH
jgi:hypothetical protein